MRIIRIAQPHALGDQVGHTEVSRKKLECGCTAILKGWNDEELGWTWQVELVSKRGNLAQNFPRPSRKPEYAPKYVQRSYVNCKTCRDFAARFPTLGDDPMMHAMEEPLWPQDPKFN